MHLIFPTQIDEKRMVHIKIAKEFTSKWGCLLKQIIINLLFYSSIKGVCARVEESNLE